MGSVNAETNVQKTNSRVLFEISCKLTFKRQFSLRMFAFKKLFIVQLILMIPLLFMVFSKPDAFGIVLFALYCCWPFLVALYNSLNEILSCEDIPDKYIFYQDRIENKDFKENNVFYYNDIKNAYETDNYFYINTEKSMWYIIDKDKFTIGNSDDMRNFLEEQLGSRFKNKKERK